MSNMTKMADIDSWYWRYWYYNHWPIPIRDFKS